MKPIKQIARRTTAVIVAALFTGIMLVPEKLTASHFRYGNITWTRTGTRTVQFQIQQAWRRSFSMGSWLAGASVGDTRNTGNFNYGTGGGGGTTSPIILTVTSIDVANDWFFGTTTLTFTYPGTSTTFTAFFEGSFRLSDPPDGPLMNNGDQVFRVETRVNLSETNGSPVSTLNPIITVQTNQAAATFNVPATDPNGRTLTWGLSSASQMGGSGLTQPSGLSINSSTGVLTFNTIGKAVGNMYNASVRVRNNLTTTTTNNPATTVDFLILIINQANPPYYVTPTPVNGKVYEIQPGESLCFTTKAQDDDPGSTVVLTVTGVPLGSSFNPVLPTSAGNPVETEFCWTPTASDLGAYLMNFTATDNTNAQANTAVTIIVSLNPVFNSPPTPAKSSIECLEGSQFYFRTVEVSTPNPGGTVQITNYIIPDGAAVDPDTPTVAGTTSSLDIYWFPDASNWGIHHFQFVATDDLMHTSNHDFDVVINIPPVITSSAGVSPIHISENQYFQYDITADDPDVPYGDEVLINVINPPSFLSLNKTGDLTATLSGTPGFGDAGTYLIHIQVTDMAEINCSGPADEFFELIVDPCTFTMTITPSQNNPVCPGATVTLQASAADSYLWSDNSTGSSINVIAGGSAAYTVTGTQAGCVTSASATVEAGDTENPVINGISSPTYSGYNIHCNGGCDGSANVDASDNCNSLTYSWDNGPFGSSATATGLCAGTHTVVVRDGSGNEASTSITLTEPSPLSVNAGLDEQTFYGYTADQTVSHTAIATGGAGSYTYSWSLDRALKCNQANSNGDESFTAGTCTNNVCGTGQTTTGAPVCSGNAKVTTKLLADGTLCVTVTDANGCAVSDCFFINSIDARCFAGNSTNVKVKVCHRTASNSNPWVQICIAEEAVPAHLTENNQDCIGLCPCSARMANSTAASDFEMSVYPNPTNTSLNIDFDAWAGSAGYELSLYDITGRVVLHKYGAVVTGGNRITIPANTVLPGVYNLMLKANNQVSSVRVVINN